MYLAMAVDFIVYKIFANHANLYYMHLQNKRQAHRKVFFIHVDDELGHKTVQSMYIYLAYMRTICNSLMSKTLSKHWPQHSIQYMYIHYPNYRLVYTQITMYLRLLTYLIYMTPVCIEVNPNFRSHVLAEITDFDWINIVK